jgi:hypothetical protein
MPIKNQCVLATERSNERTLDEELVALAGEELGALDLNGRNRIDGSKTGKGRSQERRAHGCFL